MRRHRRVAAVLVTPALAIALLAGSASAAPAGERTDPPAPSTSGGSPIIGGICGFWGPRYIIPGCPRASD